MRAAIAAILLAAATARAQTLDRGFQNPPQSAKLKAYWWWLNGNVTKKSVQKDLEEMAKKGFGGAVIFDADGSSQEGNAEAPHGPDFMSPQWLEIFRHTLDTAKRLNLEMSVNIQSGWNLGGPMVKAEDAPKKLVWSDAIATPNAPLELPIPAHAPALYKDVAVVAYPVRPDYAPQARAKLKYWQFKALLNALAFSAPSTDILLQDTPAVPGEEVARTQDVIDLTAKMDAQGQLHWAPKEGRWEVMRFGYTLNDHCTVSTSSQGWQGYAIDPFDRGAFDRYWNAVVEPLLKNAGPALKYLHTDSWEVEVANWTPTLRKEFRKRRGYDLLAYLPIVAGRIMNGRDQSDRFLNDLRRTMGDLAIDNHYRPFKEYAHRHGLLIHPESGGPHASPIDSLQCLGMDDAPMSEFWASSWTHRVSEEDRFFVKQPSSAAHTYGHALSMAEGFTTIGPHWQETIWDNLKPNFDEACCQGMNQLVWHAFVNSPESEGMPGQQYFAGTHLNPNSTWWPYSAPFFQYINRCQFMLQQGRFVADVLYYYGDHVPNFAQLKKSDPAHVLPGYDYDVATEEVLLKRLSFKDGRLVLPDGMSYRILVLPNRPAISLPVLRKLRELVLAGATVVGPKPTEATSLQGYPQCDQEVQKIARELWDTGRVVSNKTPREVLDSIATPDLAIDRDRAANFDYIHRRTSNADIYFLANRTKMAASADFQFGVVGKQPELWDPVTGEIHRLDFRQGYNGRVLLNLAFPPCGSWFVVFRTPVERAKAQNLPLWYPPRVSGRQLLEGSWKVEFDPKWGGPVSADFSVLTDWTTRLEMGIRYYSGTATYRLRFDADLWLFKDPHHLRLDLGEVHELAEVTLNGHNLGTVWTPPFQVPIDGYLRLKDNDLEIKVTNFWPNRIIGDQFLPESQRYTRTNIRKLTKETTLMPSGLLGPVRIVY